MTGRLDCCHHSNGADCSYYTLIEARHHWLIFFYRVHVFLVKDRCFQKLALRVLTTLPHAEGIAREAVMGVGRLGLGLSSTGCGRSLSGATHSRGFRRQGIVAATRAPAVPWSATTRGVFLTSSDSAHPPTWIPGRRSRSPDWVHQAGCAVFTGSAVPFVMVRARLRCAPHALDQSVTGALAHAVTAEKWKWLRNAVRFLTDPGRHASRAATRRAAAAGLPDCTVTVAQASWREQRCRRSRDTPSVAAPALRCLSAFGGDLAGA